MLKKSTLLVLTSVFIACSHLASPSNQTGDSSVKGIADYYNSDCPDSFEPDIMCFDVDDLRYYDVGQANSKQWVCSPDGKFDHRNDPQHGCLYKGYLYTAGSNICGYYQCTYVYGWADMY